MEISSGFIIYKLNMKQILGYMLDFSLVHLIPVQALFPMRFTEFFSSKSEIELIDVTTDRVGRT